MVSADAALPFWKILHADFANTVGLFMGIRQVVIKAGGRIPNVRTSKERHHPKSNSIEASSSCLCRAYSYVGQSHLHDYTDGQTVTSETIWQMLHFTSQQVIRDGHSSYSWDAMIFSLFICDWEDSHCRRPENSP